MKHIFVVNPAAGRNDSHEKIRAALTAWDGKEEYEIYLTKGPRDATVFVRDWCRSHPDEDVRFYACGGDGTLNEVANGAAGFPQASVGCYPCGSGNDFVKYYAPGERFLDLSAQARASVDTIDLIRVGDRYAINAVHFGFDSRVAQTVERVRHKKIIGGRNAYTTGVLTGLFKGMKNACRVTADGELLNPDGYLLLCTIANGQYVGGSYRCAPRSLNNDGLLEVCLVRPVSRLRFIAIAKDYQKGNHLDSPKFRDIVVYRRAKKIEIDAPDGFVYSLDGELIPATRFSVEVAPAALKFAHC